ncbi:hypothetical protein MHU86_11801 [Fragilaria crotonensis]|nr:hypothetical protein MHU86_11801 [Fragilaria crotonensis]
MGQRIPKGPLHGANLFRKLCSRKRKAPRKKNVIHRDQSTQKIAILEAQLDLPSGTNSVESQMSKSAKSKVSRSSSHSGLTAASAHSRLDKFDSSLAEIKAMFKAIMVSKRLSPPMSPTPTGIIPLHEDPLWVEPASHQSLPSEGHGMQGVQLFPPESQGNTVLALLGTPKKATNPLKRRAASTPTKSPSTSNLSLQYNEDMGSSGGYPYDNTWGDSIHDDPGDLHRIYFQNIDGLRNDADEIALYVSSMAQLKIGTFCWADPGLDFSNPIVRQSLQRPIGKHFCTSRSAFSSSTLPPDSARLSGSTSGYQPGGTFMTTTDRWATRSTGTPLVDPGLGRWSGLCYLGKRGKLLAIITAYRSPRQQPSGGFGFFDQQHSLLLSQGVSKPNVRRQFITDLVTFVNNLQSRGHEVIVSLDANEILGQDTTCGLAHLIDECTLTDLHLLGPSDPLQRTNMEPVDALTTC